MLKYIFIMRLLRFIPLLALLTILSVRVNAQGCSDAGFCSMGAMKPDQPYNKKIEFKLRSMEVSYYRASTTTTAKIMVANAEMNFSLNRKTSFQVKVPYLMASGNLGKTSGLSDLSFCLTRNVFTSDKYDINVTLGGKIPTNKSDIEDAGKPFPMYYQTSLGTYDAIAGASLITRNWLFAAGIQYPFLHQNENKFTDNKDWPDYPSPDYILSHGPAYKLERGTDVMLRAERNFRFARINFSVGLLPIYRINKDKIVDNVTDERVEVDKTTGLALSGIVTAGYSFNVRSGLKLLLGRRLVHREVNPDGLTRESVTSLSYFYRF